MDKLTIPVETWMLEKAFKFGMDYFRNPSKVIKDRTGEKNRGLGEIITAHLNGKVVEYGVTKILEKLKPGKEFIIDDKISSEFDYSQPDITDTKENSTESPAKLFTEIKNSPGNFKWMGLYQDQYEGILKHAKASEVMEDEIIIVYANIIDAFGNPLASKTADEDEKGEEEEEEPTSSAHTPPSSSGVRNYLDDREQKELDGYEQEVEELENRIDEPDEPSQFITELTKLIREIPRRYEINFEQTGKTVVTLTVPEAEVSEWRDLVKGSKEVMEDELSKAKEALRKSAKEQKEIVRQKLKKLNSKIAALGVAYKKRKSDLLGAFIKEKKLMPGYEDNFEYFFKVSDFKVSIQYIVYGEELKSLGAIFGKGIMPDPEIFTKLENSIFDANNKLRQSPKETRKILQETNSSNDVCHIPTDDITKEQYPVQFGTLECKGQVSIVELTKELKDQKTSKSIQIFCHSDACVKSDFLGTFYFKKGDTWSLKIRNQLGSRKKSKIDRFIPKRKFDEIVSKQETEKRAKKLANEI